jgi:UDP-N-acetylmuramoyl-L-alanyl-D-glutamate--2,6-diaminopimelate ligase
VDEGQPFAVLVDYAHTPDSLENVLRAAREIAGGRVIVTFGAGGDRDRGKRPLMGAAAAALADEVVVTSDNPRSEDPEAIVAEIMEGIDRADVRVEVDRRRAIADAVGLAESGDVVVIAGKGHEQGQEFAGGRKEPFDDVTVAREALRARLVS